MIAKYHGIYVDYEQLKSNCNISRLGVSLLSINEEAERLGFITEGVQASLSDLSKGGTFPCIGYWNQEHFIVIRKITKKKVLVADPGKGLITYTHKEFAEGWCDSDGNGIALLLEKGETINTPPYTKSKSYINRFINYINLYRRDFVKMAMLLLLANCFQIVLPFITQAIVDIGINKNDIGIVILLLAAQGTVIISRALASFARDWISLKVSSKINISMISEFIEKLLHLPLPFFETKTTADILQRIYDFDRIDIFLNTYALSFIFSCSSFILFSIVLLYYSIGISLIFIAGSILYIGWILLFLRRRRVLDNCIFEQQAKAELDMIEVSEGASEIRINNGQSYFRNKWGNSQDKVYSLKFKQLSLEQRSDIGSSFIIEGTSLFITFTTASMVIEGTLTLGAMLAIQFIIGQLSSPLNQMVLFINKLQDAKISFERVDNITKQDNDNSSEPIKTDSSLGPGITLNGVSFAYDSAPDQDVLDDISLYIPKGKITAIVGASGSGKTTLLKLILQHYNPSKGEIIINDGDCLLNKNSFRQMCGCVMQDGYIFTDTISRNIVPNNEEIDYDRLIQSAQMACILDFIETLPIGFETKIGQGGISLSKGQIQRILIARAIYRDVKYLFFDEATNSLDTINEKSIVNNLSTLYNERTVVVIAHRISTIINADQIVVLNNGHIAEVGTHSELIKKKSYYYKLIQNQIAI